MEGAPIPIKTVRNKIKYQTLEATFVAASASVDITLETDKNYATIIGMAMTEQIDDQSNGNTFNSPMTIDGEEVFCKGFELKLFKQGKDLDVSKRFMKMDYPANGSKINMKLTDLNVSGAKTYPYSLKFIFQLSK